MLHALPKSRPGSNFLPLSVEPRSLESIPVYDETANSSLESVVEHIVAVDNVHSIEGICERVDRIFGIPISNSSVLSHILSRNDVYVQLGEDYWEHSRTMVETVEGYVLSNSKEFQIKNTRAMPEFTQVIRVDKILSEIDRYKKTSLSPRLFASRYIECVRKCRTSNLVVVNGVVCNSKEAFIKDIYNVLLRERSPLGSIDIALRLFDSKVGVYKKTLKATIDGKRDKSKQKTIHFPLNSNEIFQLSRTIEYILEEVLETRTNIFVRLPDRRVNAYRNHIGIIQIKLDENQRLVINMTNEFDIARNVEKIIDDNKAFLNQLITQFGSKIDETEIQSRFYEKLWLAILQYDEVWGHKFHTFLHRTLKNILLDELNKNKKKICTVSLNASINDQSTEELGDIYRDRQTELEQDPSVRVCNFGLMDLIRTNFDKESQSVLFSIIDGMRDKDIALKMNKSAADIASIKKNLRRSKALTRWLEIGH